jgi:hypothetical protein
MVRTGAPEGAPFDRFAGLQKFTSNQTPANSRLEPGPLLVGIEVPAKGVTATLSLKA